MDDVINHDFRRLTSENVDSECVGDTFPSKSSISLQIHVENMKQSRGVSVPKQRKDCRCFQTSHVLGLGNRNFDYRFWNWNMDVWLTLRIPKDTILLLGSLSVEQANNKWFLNVTVSVRASNLREKHFGIGSMKLWICWLGSGNIETQHFVSRSVSKLVVSLKTDLSTASQLVISTRSDS